MKDKNRLSKIILGIVVSSVLSAAIGFVLAIIFDFTSESIPINPIYLVLTFSLIALVLTVIIILRIETVEEYRHDVTKLLGDGFMRIYKDSISEFASSLVKRSKYIRVVGTARQDVLSNRPMRSAQQYLRTLEKKLEKPCNDQSSKFTYLRVIPKTVEKQMGEHIKRCQELATSKGHTFECRDTIEFPYYISFQTFDDTDLLLIIDNKGADKKNDNQLCLWTRNKTIIEAFIKRFDNGWEEN